MSSFLTGTSSAYADDDDARDDSRGRPGLVLLYAPNFHDLRPAYPLDAAETTIGRDATNPIAVPEQAVSRRHAQIVRTAGGAKIVDLGSRNGTMVNGRFVSEAELEHLTEIRVGDAIFKYVESAADDYARFPLDGRARDRDMSQSTSELIGGYQMDRVRQDIDRIAPTSLFCLVQGETGTGKELVARALHALSGRSGAFCAINCAAIPQNLIESELFGYRRGAFSGADRDKPGLVKSADGGTLFLDEIGDMPLEAQAKLLRVLQTREFFPLGATRAESVDLRVVSATHRDVQSLVGAGRFRGDLHARLAEHVIVLPPLRDRKEDIYRLARAFAARFQKPNLELTFSALVALLHYDWPYNVRELESTIKRAIALTDGAPFDVGELPEPIAQIMRDYGQREEQPGERREPKGPGKPTAPPNAPRRKAPSEEELRALLETHQGNVAAVGRVLGKERMQIHRWLKRYGIDLDVYRRND